MFHLPYVSSRKLSETMSAILGDRRFQIGIPRVCVFVKTKLFIVNYTKIQDPQKLSSGFARVLIYFVLFVHNIPDFQNMYVRK